MDEPDKTFESFSPWRAWLAKKCEFSQNPIRVAFLKCTHVIFQNIALGKNV